jgi:hypothetical protein
VKTKKERGPLGGAKEKVHRNFLRALHESKKALKYPADSVPTLGLNTRVKATALLSFVFALALSLSVYFLLYLFFPASFFGARFRCSLPDESLQTCAFGAYRGPAIV